MSTEKSIERSPKAVLKEQEYETLLSEKNRIMNLLNRAKQTFDTLTFEIEESHKQIYGVFVPKMLVFVEQKEKSKTFFETVLKDKTVSRSLKRKLKEFSEYLFQMLDMGELESSLQDEEVRKQFDDSQIIDPENGDQRKHLKDVLGEFRSAPKEAEQRDIRKIFIQLANRFHPDKANDQQEAETYHLIMQRINSAYKMGDVAGLIEIQMEFSEDYLKKLKSSELENHFLDVIEKDIQLLKNEIERLNLQLKRVRADVRALKKSEFAQVHNQNILTEKSSGFSTSDLIDSVNVFSEILNVYDQMLTEIEKSKKETHNVLMFIAQINETFDKLPSNFTNMMKNGQVNTKGGKADFDDIPTEILEAMLQELLEMRDEIMPPKPRRKRKRKS